MPYDIPTLPELITRTQNDLGDDQSLRRTDAQVLSRAQAGSVYGLYGYLQWVFRQMFPHTCDEEVLPDHARLRPIPDRREATRAAGPVRARGSVGSVLQAGTLYQSRYGVRYRVTADTWSDGETLVPVEAVDAGALGNLAGGEQLTLVSPVLGVVAAATVEPDGLTGGADREAADAYRERLLRSYRVTPHGGSPDDYETWALEVPGVTRAWCVRRWMGAGTVAVFFVRDGEPDPIPGPAHCAEVQTYIEERQSVIPEVYALPPVQQPVTYQIRVTPDTVAVRAAVERALQSLHAAEADLGAGLLISHIREAISGAAGERDHVLYEPTADVPAAANELLTFGGVVWS
jgi:uncharacterized phage protein gp47/JayE